MEGFNPKAKAGKTLFGPIKPTNPSVRMAYKGESSFGKPVSVLQYALLMEVIRELSTIMARGLKCSVMVKCSFRCPTSNVSNIREPHPNCTIIMKY